jgi:hypothetical protein
MTRVRIGSHRRLRKRVASTHTKSSARTKEQSQRRAIKRFDATDREAS